MERVPAGVRHVYTPRQCARFSTDRIAVFTERRRAGSKIVSRGELIDGNRHLDVALALTQSTLFYENSDMHASIDLQWVREIEYDSELSTGVAIECPLKRSWA